MIDGTNSMDWLFASDVQWMTCKFISTQTQGNNTAYMNTQYNISAPIASIIIRILINNGQCVHYGNDIGNDGIVYDGN